MNIRSLLGGPCAAAAIISVALATPAPALDASAFPHVKELRGDAPAPGRPASAAFDEELYAAVDGAFGNLRLLDDGGLEVPSLVRRRVEKQTLTVESPVPSKTLSLDLREDNGIEIVMEVTGANHHPCILMVDTPLRDYDKEVSVEAGAERGAWQPLAESRPLFDYSRYLDIRNTRIEFPATPHRFLRITISNITESRPSPLVEIARESRGGQPVGEIETRQLRREDFRIDQIRLAEKIDRITDAEPVRRSYAVTDLDVREDSENRTTIVAFRLSGVPLTEITLQTDHRNFSRAASLQGKGAGDADWRTLATGTFSSIAVSGIERSQLRLSLHAPFRGRDYRLTLSNHDSPPIRVAGLEARGETHELVFLPEEGRTYRVLYGAASLRPPQYDLGAVLAQAPATELSALTAGPQAPNPSFQPQRASSIPGRWLLIGGVLAAVVVLFALLATSARRLDPH